MRWSWLTSVALGPVFAACADGGAPAPPPAPSAVGVEVATVLPGDPPPVPPAVADLDVSAAIAAFAANCLLDRLHGTITDCEMELISFEGSLAARADAGPLLSLVEALEGEDEALRIAAAHLLEERTREYFQKLSRSRTVDATLANRLVGVVAQLPPALSLKVVRGAAYAAGIAGAEAELAAMLDRHPHAVTRRIGYGQLVVYGGADGFARAKAFAEQSGDPEHDDVMAVLEGIRAAPSLDTAVQSAACAWMLGLVDHDAPWVAGLATGRIGQQCEGEALDRLLANVKRHLEAGTLRFEVVRDLREMCAITPGHPARGTTAQCDAFVALMTACAAEPRLTEDARAVCIDHVVRLRHDDEALALARRYAGHRSDKIRRRAEDSVYFLMAEPFNLK